jgi:small subunit ribosomal protein S1
MNSKMARPRETAESFSMDDFIKALDQQDYQFQVGQVVKGTVHTLETSGAYIDIGAKSLAFLPTHEASLMQVSDLAAIFPLHSEQEFLIIQEQDADGQLTVSRRRLEMQQSWEQLQALQADNQTISVRVSGVNKGGVTVSFKGLRGFIPRSHLTERDDLDSLVGQRLTVSFLEIDPERGKLVLSQRAAARAASMSQIEIGQLIVGKVSSIKPFGVFIDFEGTTGLLPINQVSNSFVKSLPDVFEVGQVVKAVIVDRDEQRGRITLSTKVLESTPGEMIDGRMDKVMEEAEIRAERLKQKADS